MSKRGKVFKRVLIGFMIVIIGLGTVFYIGLQNMLKEFSREVSKVEVNNFDIDAVNDGEYIGVYNFNETVGATVKVKVINNIIVEIEMLEHKYGRGKKAEDIVNSVIAAQSLEVDSISGATGSSTIILKAIEDALK